jgi:polyisoprenoid-binding protein YceI
MGKTCTGGGRGIGQLRMVWNKKEVELSLEFIGEGQAKRVFFLDIKVK